VKRALLAFVGAALLGFAAAADPTLSGGGAGALGVTCDPTVQSCQFVAGQQLNSFLGGPFVTDGGTAFGQINLSTASGNVAFSFKNDSYLCWNSDNSCIRYNGSVSSFTSSSSIIPSSNNAVDLGSNSLRWRNLWLGSQVFLDSTDSTGTPGAATINKPAGKSAIAASASAVVITNSLVSSTSLIFLTLIDADATCPILVVSSTGSGTFTVTGKSTAGVTTACTATTKFNWMVVN